MAKTPKSQIKAAQQWRTKALNAGRRRVELWLKPDEWHLLASLGQPEDTWTDRVRYLLQQASSSPVNTNSDYEAELVQIQTELTAMRRRIATVEAQALAWQRMTPDEPVETVPTPPQELFSLDPKDRPDRIRALVAEARRLQAEGLTLTQIAARWNAAGVPTLRWRGRPWDLKNIDNLLRRHGQRDKPNSDSTAEDCFSL